MARGRDCNWIIKSIVVSERQAHTASESRDRSLEKKTRQIRGRMSSSSTHDYPFVFCEQHQWQRSYVVCVHVLDMDAAPAYHDPCTNLNMGLILCRECQKDWILLPDRRVMERILRPCCEQHVIEEAWDKIPTHSYKHAKRPCQHPRGLE